MDGRKHSLNLIGSGRGQRLPVSFILHIDFEKNIHIYRFLYLENQEITYTEPTLVLIRVCQTWAMGMSNMGDAS